VLHHLREDPEWELVFKKFYQSLRPGGTIWISDLVSHAVPVVQEVMWRRYGEYLAAFKGEAYRDHVYAYVEREDTPKPVLFQCDLLRRVGFREVAHIGGLEEPPHRFRRLPGLEPPVPHARRIENSQRYNPHHVGHFQ
jgi:hypothetical protein